jgi:hypothetical protein
MFKLLKQYARIEMYIITNQLCWQSGIAAFPYVFIWNEVT